MKVVYQNALKVAKIGSGRGEGVIEGVNLGKVKYIHE
jgi:hypothetical protein